MWMCLKSVLHVGLCDAELRMLTVRELSLLSQLGFYCQFVVVCEYAFYWLLFFNAV